MIGANKTGVGSLSWIEFNITQVPPAGVSITSELRLDIEGRFRTEALDSILPPNSIPLSFYECTYTIPEFPALPMAFALLAILALILLKKIRLKATLLPK
jgi:hypothetical protein